MGKPVLINEKDCSVDFPSEADDRYFPEETGVAPDAAVTSLLATINVVRSYSPLARTFRFPHLTPTTLQTFEGHLNTTLDTFPHYLHPNNLRETDIRSLTPLICVQNARLLLHRHNINPYCTPEARSSAIDLCTAVALDTVSILSHCMRPGSNGEDWKPLFASCAGTLLCTHIWRCTLYLLFRQQFGAAGVCLQAITAVGDSRSANAASGRYLSFFLRCLTDRLSSGVNLDQDEDMLVYLSGDMQGTNDGNWVWEGPGTYLNQDAPSTGPASAPSEPNGEAEERQLAEKGWEWLEKTVQQLYVEQQHQEQQRQQQEQQRRESENDVPMESAPAPPSTLNPETANTEEERRSSSAHSRMTIASII